LDFTKQRAKTSSTKNPPQSAITQPENQKETKTPKIKHQNNPRGLEVFIFQNPHPRPKTQSAPTINNRERNQNQNRSMIPSCPTEKETKTKRKLLIEICRFESLHTYDSTKKERDESTCVGFEE
jgi:hypothetical protein